MAIVKVIVSSRLGRFEFEAETERPRTYEDVRDEATRAEIQSALEQATAAARRAFQIEETD